MPAVKFTLEEVKSSYLVKTPDWYRYKVVRTQTKPAKSDGSPNYIVHFVGSGEGQEMFGVPVMKMYSSKFLVPMVPLIRAANNGKDPEPNQEFNLDDLVDIELDGMTKRGDLNGSPINDIVDFRPVGG